MSNIQITRFLMIHVVTICLFSPFLTLNLWGQEDSSQSDAIRSTFLASQNWELQSVNGNQATPEALLGESQLIVLSKGFGCVKCNAQIGLLEKRFSEFANQGLTIHVFVCDEEQSLRDAIGASAKSLNFVADPNQLVFKAFLCDGKEPLHGVFLIDKLGNIRWSQTGTHAQLNLDPVLKEAAELAIQTVSQKQQTTQNNFANGVTK